VAFGRSFATLAATYPGSPFTQWNPAGGFPVLNVLGFGALAIAVLFDAFTVVVNPKPIGGTCHRQYTK
jgi:hypothetical protein